jgi:hypothetical protein
MAINICDFRFPEPEHGQELRILASAQELFDN